VHGEQKGRTVLSAANKGRGGQRKPAAERKRNSVTIRVLDDFRRKVEEAAEASKRSLSEEIAYRVNLSFAIGSELQDIADIKKATDAELKTIMRRRGWGKVLDHRYGGEVWIPPGQHALPQSHWVDLTKPEGPRPVVTMTPAVEEVLGRVVEAAVAKALARAKLTIGGEDK